jgi:hypothetical protein
LEFGPFFALTAAMQRDLVSVHNVGIGDRDNSLRKVGFSIDSDVRIVHDFDGSAD